LWLAKVEDRRSTRRPSQGAATEQMNVQMGDGFAAIGSVVHNESKTRGIDAFFAGYAGSGHKKVAEKGFVVVSGGSDPREGMFGNNQNVDRGLGFDVANGDAQVVLMNDLCGDLSGDNFLEEGHGRGVCRGEREKPLRLVAGRAFR